MIRKLAKCKEEHAGTECRYKEWMNEQLRAKLLVKRVWNSLSLFLIFSSEWTILVVVVVIIISLVGLCAFEV